MRKLNWKPDTCECQFEVLIGNSEMTLSQVYKSCADHTGTSQEIFDKAKSDNHYKNKCISKICEDHGVESGDVKWEFDNQRKLKLEHKDLMKIDIDKSIAKVK